LPPTLPRSRAAVLAGTTKQAVMPDVIRHQKAQVDKAVAVAAELDLAADR
jgi:hypothetical protein